MDEGQTARQAVAIVDLAPDDTETVRRVFDGLSAGSRYRRFQSSRAALSTPMLRQLATIRPPDRIVHVAVLDGAPVGLIHWFRLPGTRVAEVACEVVDAAQHRGIGKALFRQAARSAAEHGIDAFVASLYVGDGRLLRRARELGGVADRSEPGRYSMPVDLAAAMP